jgi:glycosyltransferase involved in cell wall biosynthesis
MNLIVDGIVFESQAHGGISRIFYEVLPRMCHLDPSMDIRIITSGPIMQPLPVHTQIKQTRIANPQRFIPNRKFPYLKQKVRGVVLGRAVSHLDETAIWHSTYFTLASKWQGRNILTMPDLIPELFPTQHNWFVQEQIHKYKKKCIEEADAIICISESTASDLQAYYNISAQKKIYIVPLAASEVFRPISRLPESYHPPTQKDFLLYVGGRQHYKNFETLLRAYSEWEQLKNVDLVVVGKKWSSSEFGLLRDWNLEQNVHLLSKVDDGELALLYNQALAFVYPSLYEGFGIPLLEAMQCGCPIIASRIPSTIEVAGECPIYFDPTNFETISHALTMAVEENKDEKRINSGFKRSQEFSWERCAKMFLEVYTDLLDKPKS